MANLRRPNKDRPVRETRYNIRSPRRFIMQKRAQQATIIGGLIAFAIITLLIIWTTDVHPVVEPTATPSTFISTPITVDLTFDGGEGVDLKEALNE